MRRIILSLAAAGVLGVGLVTAAAPARADEFRPYAAYYDHAYYDHDGWRERAWREHEWRERQAWAWRHHFWHEWYEHHYGY